MQVYYTQMYMFTHHVRTGDVIDLVDPNPDQVRHGMNSVM
jgi:hypothetical protein